MTMAINITTNQKAISFADTVLDGPTLRRIGYWARNSFIKSDKASVTKCITIAMAIDVLLRIEAEVTVLNTSHLASNFCRWVGEDDAFRMMTTLNREPDDLKLGVLLDRAGRHVLSMADWSFSPAPNNRVYVEFI